MAKRPSKQALRTLYEVEGRSLREIGVMVRRSASTVKRWFDEDGTPMRGPGRYSSYPGEEVHRLKDAGWPVTKIADKYQCADVTVRRWLKKPRSNDDLSIITSEEA